MTADGFFAHIRWSGGQMPGSTSLSATLGSGTMLSCLYWSMYAENVRESHSQLSHVLPWTWAWGHDQE